MFYAIMSQTMDKPFDEWLTEMLAKKKMRQADLVRKSGLTRQVISYYLSGKSKKPEVESLAKIAHGLQLPPVVVYEAAGIPITLEDYSERARQAAYWTDQMTVEDQDKAIDILKTLASGGKSEQKKLSKIAK